jgi:hypothetical protein
LLVILAEQVRFQAIEEIQLLALAQRLMVGDIVGDPHEFIEGENGAAMARMDQPRRDREVLVPVPLAGAQCRRIVGHCSKACTRPFHIPPLPRAYCRAESRVNSM